MSLADAELEVDIRGAGEPVVLIQTALTADEFLPLASHPDLSDNYRVILYHRRGYAGSSPVEGPGSIERDALDCRQLLAALDVERAHVMGVSYSAAVALQLAATSPRCVHSLCVIEPPPVHIPSADEFLAANAQLAEDHRRLGSAVAIDRFLVRVVGPTGDATSNGTFRADLLRLNEMPKPSSPPTFRHSSPGVSPQKTHGASVSPSCASGVRRAGRGSQRPCNSSCHGFRRLKRCTSPALTIPWH